MNDITINRHKRNPESMAANPDATTKADFRDAIIAYAATGAFTLKDAMRHFGRPANEVSPRLSELKADGILEPTGDRREGCAVLRLISGRV